MRKLDAQGWGETKTADGKDIPVGVIVSRIILFCFLWAGAGRGGGQ